MDLIEKIVYINLDYRTDRNQSILQTLKDIPSEKIQRFSAIREKVGRLGCTKSHIAVLKMAISQRWKNVLIMEDDMSWKTKDNLDTLRTLIQNPYDVIVLAGMYSETIEHKLVRCHGTGAYLVNQSYYKTLLANFEEGYSLLYKALTKPIFRLGGVKIIADRSAQYDYTIDMFWTILQAKDNWFILSMFHSLPQYSDVLNDVINYDGIFY